MNSNSREQEDADFTRAAQGPKPKTRVRPILFTLGVMVATLVAGFPVGFIVFPDDPEKFGALWFRVTMIAGVVAFLFFEGLAFRERRLLKQNPDLWGRDS